MFRTSYIDNNGTLDIIDIVKTNKSKNEKILKWNFPI